MNISLRSIFRDAARAIRNRKYEFTDDGRLFLGETMGFIGGYFRHRYAAPILRPDARGILMPVRDAMGQILTAPFGTPCIEPNRLTKQGLIKLVNLLGGHVSSAALYIAPFSGNVTPQDDWTGADFTSNATEFTAYTGSNRLPWTTVAATSTPQIINTAALAAATMTLAAGGPHTIRGAGLIEGAAKSATTGALVVASRFDADLTGLAEGGKVAIEYGINATDEADV